MLESAIQSKIIKQLEKEGWYVIKYMKTTKNGWPDLGAHKMGRIVYIEVKVPGEEPTPLQLFRHGELRKQGFEVIGCATSVKDTQHLC